MNILCCAALHRSRLGGDWLIARFLAEFIEFRHLCFVKADMGKVLFYGRFSSRVDKNVHRFPDKDEIVVLVIASHAPGELVVTMNIFQSFKYLSGNTAFSILRTVEG